MEILVTGGTGFVGTGICKELHRRDHSVTALSRSPTPSRLPDGVETVAGDVRDQESIADAFAGKDAVVHLVALSPLRIPPGGEEQHDTVTRQGTANVVEQAEAHDVDRFAYQSGLGADPDASTHYLRAKGRAETIVRESTLDWTIIRPSVIFGDGAEIISFTRRLTPPILAPLPGGGKTPFQLIYLGDLAPMIGDAVTVADHIGETYTLGGPEVLTLKEIAKLIRRAQGQSTTIIPIPMALAGLGMSVFGKVPGFPFGSDQYEGLKQEHTIPDNDVTAFDVTEDELTTFRDYLGADTASRR